MVEVLPFIRGLANDIRGALGDDHPGLIPTVMAAYALTSFLTGGIFVIMSLLKLGNFVRFLLLSASQSSCLSSRFHIFLTLSLQGPSAPSESPSSSSDWGCLSLLRHLRFPSRMWGPQSSRILISVYLRPRSCLLSFSHCLCAPASFKCGCAVSHVLRTSSLCTSSLSPSSSGLRFVHCTFLKPILFQKGGYSTWPRRPILLRSSPAGITGHCLILCVSHQLGGFSFFVFID
jgi:hypothetical protein